MPDELFEPLAALPDHELAEAFGVPFEQIERKRQDLDRASRSRIGRAARATRLG